MKTKPDPSEPTPPEQLAQREAELRDQGAQANKGERHGWRRLGNPKWVYEGGRSVATKAKRTTSVPQIKAQNAVAMANLARSAMAKFGYDGTGLGGAEGYMTMLAQRFPLQFMTDIIAKMIPANVDAHISGQVDITQHYASAEEARRDIGQLAVPLDLLLERDDPPLIEVEVVRPVKPNGEGNGHG